MDHIRRLHEAHRASTWMSIVVDTTIAYTTMTAYTPFMEYDETAQNQENVWTGKRAKILVRKKGEPGGVRA